MARASNFTFINDCRNSVWLSGYARPQSDGTYLLYQSSNDATAIPLVCERKSLRFPASHIACEVRCHAVGLRNPETSVSEIRLVVDAVKRASVTAAPRGRTLMNALRAKDAAAANPFAPREEVVAEVKESLQFTQEAVEMLLSDASKRVGHDGYVNRVMVSGFVGHKAFIPPSDDGSGDLGCVRFLLMQSAEMDVALPVEVIGADSRFGKEIRALLPMLVIGRVRVVAQRDDEGNIASRKVTLATSRGDVGLATLSDFAAKAWPAWWREVTEAHFAQRRELSARNAAQQAAAQEQAATSDPVAAAPESGWD